MKTAIIFTTFKVAVPASGTATLRLFVQNNMGYPLPDFTLKASAPGFEIQAVSGPSKVRGFLMPGERLDIQLTIVSSAATTLRAGELSFYVGFGRNRQAERYPTAPGRAAVVLAQDGGVLPASTDDPFPGIGTGNAEARDLQYAAQADFGDTQLGIDSLLQLYCAGRASWDHSSEQVIPTYCPTPDHTQCPARATFPEGAHTTLYDWPKLWAAGHLAARKTAAAQRLPTFRQRLMCGYADDNMPFRAMATILLGYLGEDTTTRTFLETRLDAGSREDQRVAKAALLLLGQPDDRTRYHDDVVQGLVSEDPYVAGACAAVLGIVDGDDHAVQEILMKRATWTEPELADNGRGFYNAHLLALVAAARAQAAPASAGLGYASFYQGDPIEQPSPPTPDASSTSVPPESGTSCSCSLGRADGNSPWSLAGLVVLALVRQRRRRARGKASEAKMNPGTRSQPDGETQDSGADLLNRRFGSIASPYAPTTHWACEALQRQRGRSASAQAIPSGCRYAPFDL